MLVCSHDAKVINDILEAKCSEGIALTLEELAHELYPVQADRVQHYFHHVHSEKHAKRGGRPADKSNEELQISVQQSVRHNEKALTPMTEPFSRELAKSMSKNTLAS